MKLSHALIVLVLVLAFVLAGWKLAAFVAAVMWWANASSREYEHRNHP